MRSSLLWVGVSVCALLAGCASRDDIRAMRRPDLPPDQVALAPSSSVLFESIAVYEVLGTPEFRLFDEGGLITTRPTRSDVSRVMSAWLTNADLLASDIAHSRYLLTVEFQDLRGPDVIPFTDKRASGRVRYELIERRTGSVLFEGTYESAMQARMPGVTPEMVRTAIGGGLVGVGAGELINNTSDGDAVLASAAAFGLIGAGSAGFTADHDTTIWAWPEARFEAIPRIARGAGLGIVFGGAVAPDMDDSNSAPAARTAGAAVGAITGLLAAAPAGRESDDWQSSEMQGSFWGTDRRAQAVRGMMRQNFNAFLFGLSNAHLITIRDAVTCDALNPNGYGSAVLVSTPQQVGYDCPTNAR